MNSKLLSAGVVSLLLIGVVNSKAEEVRDQSGGADCESTLEEVESVRLDSGDSVKVAEKKVRENLTEVDRKLSGKNTYKNADDIGNLEKEIKNADVDWKRFRAIEKSIERGETLGENQKKFLESLTAQAIKTSKDQTSKSDVESSVDRALLNRVQRALSRFRENEYPDPADEEGDGNSQQGQQGQQGQSQKGQPGDSEDEGDENAQGQADEGQSSEGSESQSSQGSGSGDYNDQDQSDNGDAKEAGSNDDGEGDKGKTPPVDLKTPDGVSEALLRYMYLWELRKFSNSRNLVNGLQGFFNFLQAGSDRFAKDHLTRYRALVKDQLARLHAEKASYSDLNDFNLKIKMAADSGDMETLYQYATSLLRTLNEIKKYDDLTAEEQTLFSALSALITLIKSNVEDSAFATAKRFLGELPGEISREEMRNRFGSQLVTKNTKSLEKFWHAIKKDRLWTYRLMSLMRPYLNIKLKARIIRRKQKNMYGRPSIYAEGPRGTKQTDDPSYLDRFKMDETKEQMISDVADGKQLMYANHSEVDDPIISKKAIKKVSILAYDVSGSMAQIRAIVRNLLLAAYCDFYQSELMSNNDVRSGKDKKVTAHTIFAFPFTDNPGKGTTIRTRKQSIQFIKSLNANPENNTNGGTKIQNALVHALNKIKVSKAENQGDLQTANIVLISDGDDADIDVPAIQKLRKEIGEDTEIVINIILLGGENAHLKSLALSGDEANPEKPVMTYKQLSQEELEKLVAESHKLPKIDEFEKKQAISNADFRTHSTAIRSAVSQLVRAGASVSSESKRPIEQADTIKKMSRIFDPNVVTLLDMPPETVSKTKQILEVIGQSVRRLAGNGADKAARAQFMGRLVAELCSENGIRLQDFQQAAARSEFHRYRFDIKKWLDGN